jgi:hypothetical protein
VNKTHWISYRHESRHPNPVGTHCGLHGVAEQDSDNEFSTIKGDRFEAYPGDQFSRVTCKRCQKSAERRSYRKR